MGTFVGVVGVLTFLCGALVGAARAEVPASPDKALDQRLARLAVGFSNATVDTLYATLSAKPVCVNTIPWQSTYDQICSAKGGALPIQDASKAAGEKREAEVRGELLKHYTGGKLDDLADAKCLADLGPDIRKGAEGLTALRALDAANPRPPAAEVARTLVDSDVFRNNFDQSFAPGDFCGLVTGDDEGRVQPAAIDAAGAKSTAQGPLARIVLAYLKTPAGVRAGREICEKKLQVNSVTDPRLKGIVDGAWNGGWNAGVPAELRHQTTKYTQEEIDRAAAYGTLSKALGDPSFRIPALAPAFEKATREVAPWDYYRQTQKSAAGIRGGECGAELDVRCVCMARKFGDELNANLGKVMVKTKESVVKQSRDAFGAMLDGSAFSGALKESFRKASDVAIRKAGSTESFSNYLASGNSNFNASWSPIEQDFSINMGTAEIAGDPKYSGFIGAVFMHEWGHFVRTFPTAHERGTSMVKWNSEDEDRIKKVVDCIDDNITRGEFATYALEGKTKKPPSPADIENKRSEYFADLFQKHYLRKQPREKAVQMLSTFCPSRKDERWFDEHGARQMSNEHPSIKYRILNLAAGIVPLAGNDYGLPPPRECDKLIWPND